MTRICAFLARRPSVGMLIPIVLDIPPHIAQPVLEALYAHGYIGLAGIPILAMQTIHSATEPAPNPESAVALSFLSKLWKYLRDKKQASDNSGSPQNWGLGSNGTLNSVKEFCCAAKDATRSQDGR